MSSAPFHLVAAELPVAAPAPELLAPTPDDIITAWAQNNADPYATAQHLGLSLPHLLRLIADPAVAKTLEIWEARRAAHFKLLALETHATTASRLCEKLQTCDDFTEFRRAAAIILRWSPFSKGPPADALSTHTPSPANRATPTSPATHSASSAHPVSSSPLDCPPNPLPDSQPNLQADPQPHLEADHDAEAEADLRTVVSSLLDDIQADPDPIDIAERIASDLAPAATLDHAPLPPDSLDDPDLLADLIEDSTLADLAAAEITDIETLKLSDTDAAIRVHCDADPAHPIKAYLTFTREPPSSPWLITSIFSQARAAPSPQSASP